MNIKFFKGRLGEESFLAELESDVVPRKFLKRYIWPFDEE